MKNQKYKMLVLSDLKDTTENVLKSTVSLSKVIDADVEFFHVKRPTEIVERESQLSAMRSINKEHILMDKKLQDLSKSVTKDFKVKMKHNFTFGNVKSEIEKRIKETNPDIIVLGKKKPKALSFVGDNITDFIIKNYKGTVVIAGKNTLEPNKELSLGVLNSSKKLSDMAFSENLLTNTKSPLKSFKIIEKTSKSEVKSVSNENTVEYIFEKGDNAIKSLSNYLTKSNVNLLCLNREEQTDKSQLNSIMKTVDVSLLLGQLKPEIAN